MRRAIDWLIGEDLHGTYAVGLRAQVWNLFPGLYRTKGASDGRELDKEFMLFSRGLNGPGKGFYGYSYGVDKGLANFKRVAPLSHVGSGGRDRSNSQFGVFGAWVVEHAGAEIPTAYWTEEDEAWKRDQNLDGGWSYMGKGGQSTPTMTAAGLATLYITQTYVMRTNSHQFDVCKGGVFSPNIDKGLAWMDQHAQAAVIDAQPYGLFGVERLGAASGRKYFGNIDWYGVGAGRLVKKQDAGGSLGTLHDTAFAVLFLTHGRAPVMMNKLIYDVFPNVQNAPWNERPRDIAHLAEWMGRHCLCSFLNWQTVELKNGVENLHDAPILYISGSAELTFNNQEINQLRQYVEEGGMILGNADCGSILFAQSFRQLGAKLCPKYEFRQLPPTHLIFSEMYLARKWKSHPTVEGLSNGVREMMILIPDADPAHAWQIEAHKSREVLHQLAANIFLYATGLENLGHRGEPYIVRPEGPPEREIKVARIEAGENWDPEPGKRNGVAASFRKRNGVAAGPLFRFSKMPGHESHDGRNGHQAMPQMVPHYSEPFQSPDTQQRHVTRFRENDFIDGFEAFSG